MAISLKPSSNYSRRRRQRFQPNTDINITPLVDVMLVLLIIFMITAPMLTVGVPVDLPKTQAAQMNDQVEPLVISINAQEQIYLQETEVSLNALVGRLQAITGQNADARIYVRGDKKLAYGKIMEIMGAVAAAGYSKVSLIAEMPTSTPAKATPKPNKSKPKPQTTNKLRV
jgi:biopolymer transport protein TolR